MNKKFVFSIVLLSLFLVSFAPSSMKKTQITIELADGAIKNLNVELALTEEEQAQGFMKRKNIPDGTGMLFVFDVDKIASFWMKNTPTPLSIAFINSDGKIRDLFDMRPFSEKSVKSTGYVRYALEVPQGWFEKNGVKCGDRLIVSNLSVK